MKDALGYYELLQVSADADFDTIKHSYRDLAKIWHPDNNHDPKATDVFQKTGAKVENSTDLKQKLLQLVSEIKSILLIVLNQMLI